MSRRSAVAALASPGADPRRAGRAGEHRARVLDGHARAVASHAGERQPANERAAGERGRHRAPRDRERRRHGPEQPGGDARQRGQPRRGDEHQAAHPLGMARGEQDRDGAAHRMADEVVRTAHPGVLEPRHQVVGDLLAARSRDPRPASRRSQGGRARSRAAERRASGIVRRQIALLVPAPCTRTSGSPRPSSRMASIAGRVSARLLL